MNIYSEVLNGKQKQNFVSFQNFPADAANSNLTSKKNVTIINLIINSLIKTLNSKFKFLLNKKIFIIIIIIIIQYQIKKITNKYKFIAKKTIKNI